MTTLHKFSNLVELLIYFNNEQKCRDYLEQIRWPNGIICPHCSHEKCFKYKNGKKYRCSGCKMDFSIRTGTIFADSRITLQKWFAAIYLITSHKKGISSLQLHRDLGVTQKTAWFMLHRIRKTLKIETSEKLSGIIEADETYIGGNIKANEVFCENLPVWGVAVLFDMVNRETFSDLKEIVNNISGDGILLCIIKHFGLFNNMICIKKNYQKIY